MPVECKCSSLASLSCCRNMGPQRANKINSVDLLNGDDNENVGMCRVQTGLFGWPTHVQSYSLISPPGMRAGFMDSLANQD